MHEKHIDPREVITMPNRTEEKNMRPRSKVRPNMKRLLVKITKPHKIRITHGDRRLRTVGSMNQRGGGGEGERVKRNHQLRSVEPPSTKLLERTRCMHFFPLVSFSLPYTYEDVPKRSVTGFISRKPKTIFTQT